MTGKIALTRGLTNTQYAPLAVLFAHYQQREMLEPLDEVEIRCKKRDFSPKDKLNQLLLSILAGCKTLSEVNIKFKHEIPLADALGWPRIADQSNLSRFLDGLSQTQNEQLRAASTQIWRSLSRTVQHDWRGYLWLDYDFSGLPCSSRAEKSQKGYFSDKKTGLGVN